MQGKLLKKEGLRDFLQHLMKKAELVAPVKTDTLRFQTINNPEEVCLEGLPIMPIKKYYLEHKHTILNFKGTQIRVNNPAPKKRIIFGVRLCDLNAIPVLDKLFLEENPDPYYQSTRDNTVLVGWHCDKPVDEYCFCESMELKPFYDLYIYEVADSYFIAIGSKKGADLVKHLPSFEYEPTRIKCSKKLEKKDLNRFLENPTWKEASKDCLSCGPCTNYCPTCLCFDIEDEVELDGKTGERKLHWDSCQYKDFTLVAGGFAFRQTKADRFRHRIFHKIQYFKDKFGIYMCTGCGRCIRWCPTRIDFVEIINRLR